MSRRWLWLSLAVLACEPPQDPQPSAVCVPGETKVCNGPARCVGGQACRGDGTGFMSCDCGDAGASAQPPPRQSTHAQCARLLEAINDGNRRLAGVEGDSGESMVERLRGNAVVLRATAKQIRALAFTDADVKKLQDDYATLTEEIARGSDGTANALAVGSPAALDAGTAMSNYDARETAFMNRLEQVCSDKPQPVTQ